MAPTYTVARDSIRFGDRAFLALPVDQIDWHAVAVQIPQMQSDDVERMRTATQPIVRAVLGEEEMWKLLDGSLEYGFDGWDVCEAIVIFVSQYRERWDSLQVR